MHKLNNATGLSSCDPASFLHILYILSKLESRHSRVQDIPKHEHTRN